MKKKRRKYFGNLPKYRIFKLKPFIFLILSVFYFGQLFGYPMTFADISRTMGSSISQVTTAFRKGTENMKKSAEILEISPEEVREVL